MITQLMYWKPTVADPGGHVALWLAPNLFCSFWPEVALTGTSIGPAPGRVNTNSELEYFTLYIRENALEHIRTKKMRLPSGLYTYSVLFTQCREIINEKDDSALETYFADIDKWSDYLGDQRSVILSASVELAKWLRDRAKTYNGDSIEMKKAFLEAVTITSTIKLDFLDTASMTSRYQSLTTRMDLRWYSQVGSQTDNYLNTGKKLYFPSLLLPKDTSGLQYFTQGQQRHNCASFILDILEAGGLDRLTRGFHEKTLVVNALKEMITLKAQSTYEELDQKQLKKAEMVKYMVGPLSFFGGYGSHPITKWFGSTPRVVDQLVHYAQPAGL